MEWKVLIPFLVQNMLKKNRKDLNLWKWNWAKISAFFMSHFCPSSLLLYFQTLNNHLLKKGRMRAIFRFTWTFLCIWILCFLNKIWESNCETSWLIAFGVLFDTMKSNQVSRINLEHHKFLNKLTCDNKKKQKTKNKGCQGLLATPQERNETDFPLEPSVLTLKSPNWTSGLQNCARINLF